MVVTKYSVVYGLDFRTDTEYLVTTIYFGYGTSSGNNIETHIVFNDQIVFQAETENASSGEFSTGFAHVKIIIPPFTHVQIGAINVSTADTRISTIALSGKVQGAIQQENLESITNNNKWASL